MSEISDTPEARARRGAEILDAALKIHAAERERQDLIARLTAPYIYAEPFVLTPQKRLRMITQDLAPPRGDFAAALIGALPQS